MVGLRCPRWPFRLAMIALGILSLSLAVGACSAMGASIEGERLEALKRSPQHDGEAFRNRLPHRSPSFFRAMFKVLSGGEAREPAIPPPIIERVRADYDAPPESGLRITWLGHSSSLIEIDGARVLFDPMWGERASPVGFAGPKRFHPPPLALDQLPAVDVIVISHDHYDHLDMPTIEALHDLDVPWVVPLGVGAHLEHWGVPADRITELDWWSHHRVAGLELHATPARHFSGRGLGDRNATLWAAWAIVGPRHRVFFSGDGGYFDGFAEIGRRLGPFDVTLMEVGAYDALWADMHMGPEQAVAAHLDLRGRLLLPVHWGTFNLAAHGWTEPVERLFVAARRAKVRLRVPRAGERLEPAALPKLVRWWPKEPWQSAEQAPIRSSGLESTSGDVPTLGPRAATR